MKCLSAEFLGTFTLVFVGTGAIVVNQISGGVIGHVGISLVFGLVVLAMIHTLGDVSGAHLNPAVTLGLAVAGRFPWRDAPSYACAQFAGGLAASGLLKFLFPSSSTLGATLPSGSWLQSLVLETVLVGILMLVILSVSIGPQKKRPTAGIAIGSVIGLEALFAGPISGASMNPARSIAPALMSGTLEHLWLYPASAVLGATIGVLLCSAIKGPTCCGCIRSQNQSDIE